MMILITSYPSHRLADRSLDPGWSRPDPSTVDLRHGERGHQERQQDSDDANHGQQLDDGESGGAADWICVVHVRPCTP